MLPGGEGGEDAPLFASALSLFPAEAGTDCLKKRSVGLVRPLN